MHRPAAKWPRIAAAARRAAGAEDMSLWAWLALRWLPWAALGVLAILAAALLDLAR